MSQAGGRSGVREQYLLCNLKTMQNELEAIGGSKQHPMITEGEIKVRSGSTFILLSIRETRFQTFHSLREGQIGGSTLRRKKRQLSGFVTW